MLTLFSARYGIMNSSACVYLVRIHLYFGVKPETAYCVLLKQHLLSAGGGRIRNSSALPERIQTWRQQQKRQQSAAENYSSNQPERNLLSFPGGVREHTRSG